MTTKRLHLKTIDLFFETLAKEWPHPTEILLIGGAVALIVGSGRITEDIDFEATLHSRQKWNRFQETISKIKEKLGIRVEFNESIERWSMISFLDYTKHRIQYKRYGKIKVMYLDPVYWGIGKVSRYLDQDIKDMILVFSKGKTDPLQLARLWQKALKQSPASSRLFNVRNQMADFFKTYGPKIWKKIPLDEIMPLFEE